MSKPKTDAETLVEHEALPVAGLVPVKQGYPGTVWVFRDKVYTSRFLILPDGGTLPVVAGRVTASDDEQLAFLTAHPDLEPLPE